MVQITIGESMDPQHKEASGEISAAGFLAEEASKLGKKIGRRFLVVVDEHATGCCIDGRKCVHTLAQTTTVPGPSVAGGPSVTAYGAAELAEGYFDDKHTLTSQWRFKEVSTKLQQAGIMLGAHVSDSAVRNGLHARDAHTGELTDISQTGCGASDRFKDIMNRLADSKEFIETTTAALLDTGYNPAAMRFNSKRTIEKSVKDYDSKQAVDSVASAADVPGTNVEVLEGTHAEVLVVFNYVKGTTVDRDAVVSNTGKQVFMVDMWYFDKLANAMVSGRPDAIAMHQKLKHAMTAFQIATYLTLCDGTHRPVILKPESPTVPAEV